MNPWVRAYSEQQAMMQSKRITVVSWVDLAVAGFFGGLAAAILFSVWL